MLQSFIKNELQMVLYWKESNISNLLIKITKGLSEKFIFSFFNNKKRLFIFKKAFPNWSAFFTEGMNPAKFIPSI
jgi:hypothetical protein